MSTLIKPDITLKTPCIGRCSTTFGDDICRGCRRYSNEIISWNGLPDNSKNRIWVRLNNQLDQIVINLLPNANFDKVLAFLKDKKISQPEKNSVGRVYYLAIKFCYKFPIYILESGLNVDAKEVKKIWLAIENESYELANLENRKIHIIDIA